MSIVKKTNANYVIQTPRNASSNITLDTDTVYIPGNLTVLGSTTSVETNNTTLKDNIIVLNDGETGAGVANGSGTSGILIDRGTLANVTLRWNEANGGSWQITSDGSTYANILSSTSGSTGLSKVQDDTSPALGGNLNVNGYTVYASTNAATSYIILQGGLQMKYANVTYNAANGSTVFNAAAEGAGQAGLYVTNLASNNEELITKRRAFGFSILMG